MLFSELAVAGGVGFLEHPEYPSWKPQAASIWKTDVVRQLDALPFCSTHSFDQGEYGAKAKAPTTLLLLRLPEAKWRLDQTPGKGRAPPGKFAPLAGRSSDGSWRTAVKKLYPSELCRVLADLMVQSSLFDVDDVGELGDAESSRPLFESMLRDIDPEDNVLSREELAKAAPDYAAGGGQGLAPAYRGAGCGKLEKLRALGVDGEAVDAMAEANEAVRLADKIRRSRDEAIARRRIRKAELSAKIQASKEEAIRRREANRWRALMDAMRAREAQQAPKKDEWPWHLSFRCWFGDGNAEDAPVGGAPADASGEDGRDREATVGQVPIGPPAAEHGEVRDDEVARSPQGDASSDDRAGDSGGGVWGWCFPEEDRTQDAHRPQEEESP